MLSGLLKKIEIKPVESRWGKDNVEVTLPKELAILQPAFWLLVDSNELAPEDNRIAEDVIRLTFEKVAEFAKEDLEGLGLAVNSPFADLALKWLAKQRNGSFELDNVEKK